MARKPLSKIPLEVLGRRVYASLERLDELEETLGKRDKRRSELARSALFEILRRLEPERKVEA